MSVSCSILAERPLDHVAEVGFSKLFNYPVLFQSCVLMPPKSKPLHLSNTIYPSDNKMPKPFIHGYGWMWEHVRTPDSKPASLPDVSEAFDPSSPNAAGAMIADVYDLKSWIENLYKGTLLKPETQAERLTLVSDLGIDIEDDKLRLEYGLEYGLGILFQSDPPMWGHGGTIDRYLSWAWYCPSENLTLVVVYNSIKANPLELVSTLTNAYLESTKR